MRKRSRIHSNYYWLILGFIVLAVIIFVWTLKEHGSKNVTGNTNALTNDARTRNNNSQADQGADSNKAINSTPSQKTVADLPTNEANCTAAQGAWHWKDERCWPNDEATCKVLDGLWSASGSGAPVCLVLTADSGKICKDNGECQGLCIVGDDQLRGQTARDDELTDIQGTCAPRIPVQGCVTAVTGGIPGVVCVGGE